MEYLHQCLLLLLYIRLTFPVILGNPLQQILKSRQAMAWNRWKIGTAEKWLLRVVTQEHG